MALLGIDVHPGFQRGLNIEQVAAEGFAFLSVKLTEGTSNTWVTMGSQDWIRRGKAAGLLCLGYAYLRPGSIRVQAEVFAAALDRCDVPGVIDAEALDSDATGRLTLTIGMIREFHTTLLTLGARIPFLYLPRWWWQRIGSPPLDGLPMLWASSYPSTRRASATELYRAVTPDRWASYGGLPVGVLQFAETALVAGIPLDANAFLGTKTQFATMIGAPVLTSATTTPETIMSPWRLDRTPVLAGKQAGPDAPDGTWPAVEDTISSCGPAAGWRGKIVVHIHVGWGGAFVQEAWALGSGRHFVDRYDPDKKTGGRYLPQFDATTWELAAGERGLVIRCATPTGGSVGIEPQH